MVIKKKALPRAPVVLSAEERRCVIQFVGILVEVDQRVSVRHVEGRHVSANKRKTSEEKGTQLKQKQINKARKFCGPCFLSQTLYPETGNCKIKNPLKWFDKLTTSGFYIQRDCHDRHYSFNIY